MNKTPNIKIIKGKIPVLVSAPHAHSHRRPSLTLSHKIGEGYTDKMVTNICEGTGAWGMYIVGETDYDPNYHKLEDNPYKDEVTRLIKENDIKKFIDLHGLSSEYDYDLGIYYPSKFSNSIKLAKEIVDCVDKKKMRGINHCVLRFEDLDRETLGEYVASQLRVPSVQLEIARYIREKDELRNSLIENLSEYLRM